MEIRRANRSAQAVYTEKEANLKGDSKDRNILLEKSYIVQVEDRKKR